LESSALVARSGRKPLPLVFFDFVSVHLHRLLDQLMYKHHFTGQKRRAVIYEHLGLALYPTPYCDLISFLGAVRMFKVR
jgi:hypothetical protein